MKFLEKSIKESNIKKAKNISSNRLVSQKRAQKLIQFRQYKQILTDSDILIESKQAKDSTYYYKGLATAYLKQYTQAITNFTKAIQINSEYTEAYQARGKVHAILRKNDLALADFTEAINLNKKDANSYFYRALLHHTDRNYELAYADYENTLFLDPKNKIARVNRSIAIEILEKKLQQNQNFLYQPAY